MMEYLAAWMISVGYIATISGIVFGIFKIISYIKQKKNPIKVYIRKVVYDYLRELQNEE